MEKGNIHTEGKILNAILRLAFPIIMTNVLQTMYQLVDTFWLGRLGANAVASVSLSFPILFLVVSLGGGLTLAGTVIVSQHKGANDQRMVNYAASQTVMVIFFTSILLAVVGYYAAAPLMKLVGAGNEILNDSVAYFKVSSWGFIFMFMFFVYQSLMRGIGNVMIPMYIVLGTVLLNLVLDPLFIFGYGAIPGYGVAGAAVASIFTQAISAFIGLFILFRGKRGIKIKFFHMKPNFPWVKNLFALGLPSSLDQSSRAAAMTAMVMLVTSYSSDIVAAYGVGARILSLVIVPALGLSIATTSLVGQNIGAGRMDRAEKVGDLSTLMAVIGLTVLGMLLFFFAEPLTRFFVPDDPEVIKEGATFIKIMAPSFGLLGVQQVLNGVFNGAGLTKVSMLISICALWVARFPMAFMLSNKTDLNYEGIWWAFPVSNVIAAIIAFSYYKSGSWKVNQPQLL
ncbi:MATE family efflux transporter [Galbibacter pacificus]|uniref:Multidrug-efflux transporter n=1 Tax=Galbibacter pacificus TaxID=2996052 RepID=A0ABT6FMC7_9FLAO|nr:MATE family efflux transporter [Galbibacter pacificus]MDG3580940.1 MATE family efflux transporter [Galbibacter pacificus]MDG3584418.1 MATE family efflux transporter [Galbibacter pacificus]